MAAKNAPKNPRKGPTAVAAAVKAKVKQAKSWRTMLVAPNPGWREREEQRNELLIDKDRLYDTVYALALEGASLTSIADRFGFKRIVLEKMAGDIWLMGRAELEDAFRRDLVERGLNPKSHPVLTIWAGKQLAGFRDSPVAEVNIDTASASITLNINPVKAQRDEQYNTVEPKVVEAKVIDVTPIEPDESSGA